MVSRRGFNQRPSLQKWKGVLIRDSNCIICHVVKMLWSFHLKSYKEWFGAVNGKGGIIEKEHFLWSSMKFSINVHLGRTPLMKEFMFLFGMISENEAYQVTMGCGWEACFQRTHHISGPSTVLWSWWWGLPLHKICRFWEQYIYLYWLDRYN